MAPAKSSAPATLLSGADYRRLLSDLCALLDQGRQRAEHAVAHHLVATYHAIGKRLVAQQLTDHAGYGDATVTRLAGDLAVGRLLLYRAMALARSYPDGPPESGLRWSHYRELLAVADPRERAWYEAEAQAHRWPATKLVQAIRAKDAGPHAYGQLPRPGCKRKPKPLERPAHPLHVYKARILRVVDGDTLLADVDLGFQVHKEQRLRLAAIDTPPLDSPAGAEAAAYVQERLATVDFVVVWTVKIDLYGRYVAHVCYQPDESDKRLVARQGCYLNQELVDRGLARAL